MSRIRAKAVTGRRLYVSHDEKFPPQGAGLAVSSGGSDKRLKNMYQPPHFREEDLGTQHALIGTYPLGLLVTSGAIREA